MAGATRSNIMHYNGGGFIMDVFNDGGGQQRVIVGLGTLVLEVDEGQATAYIVTRAGTRVLHSVDATRLATEVGTQYKELYTWMAASVIQTLAGAVKAGWLYDAPPKPDDRQDDEEVPF